MVVLSVSLLILCTYMGLCMGELRTETMCAPADPVCEFHLRISNSWTMMHFTSSGLMLPVVVDGNGTFYARSKSCEDLIPLTSEGMAHFIYSKSSQLH